jgi:hypothetical protein
MTTKNRRRKKSSVKNKNDIIVCMYKLYFKLYMNNMYKYKNTIIIVTHLSAMALTIADRGYYFNIGVR